MSRAIVSLEIGRINSASVVPLAEDPDRALLTIEGEAARVVLEVRLDELWPVATACRDGVRLREMQRTIAERGAEVGA